MAKFGYVRHDCDDVDFAENLLERTMREPAADFGTATAEKTSGSSLAVLVPVLICCEVGNKKRARARVADIYSNREGRSDCRCNAPADAATQLVPLLKLSNWYTTTTWADRRDLSILQLKFRRVVRRLQHNLTLQHIDDVFGF